MVPGLLKRDVAAEEGGDRRGGTWPLKRDVTAAEGRGRCRGTWPLRRDVAAEEGRDRQPWSSSGLGVGCMDERGEGEVAAER